MGICLKTPRAGGKATYTTFRDQTSQMASKEPSGMHPQLRTPSGNQAMKLYKMVVRDDAPEMVQISEHGTITMPDGKLYWIIPVEPEPTPTQPTLQESQESQIDNESEEERVIALLKKGVRSTSEIARRAGTTPYSVEQIIHAAGLKTPSETLRAKIEETLRKAGAAGVSKYEIGKLAYSSQQIGPIMAAMLRHGEVWRLTNGNYAMYQAFNKEGNP